MNEPLQAPVKLLRFDQEGRDVTELPGLWDESDHFINSESSMIIPYQYREFNIEGFYHPIETEEGSKMGYEAYATRPDLKGLFHADGESWEEAKANIETAIDELIASWN